MGTGSPKQKDLAHRVPDRTDEKNSHEHLSKNYSDFYVNVSTSPC